MPVVVEDAVEAVMPVDARVGGSIRNGDRFEQGCQWSNGADAPVRPVPVVEVSNSRDG
jgi:hypothetical protein